MLIRLYCETTVPVTSQVRMGAPQAKLCMCVVGIYFLNLHFTSPFSSDILPALILPKPQEGSTLHWAGTEPSQPPQIRHGRIGWRQGGRGPPAGPMTQQQAWGAGKNTLCTSQHANVADTNTPHIPTVHQRIMEIVYIWNVQFMYVVHPVSSPFNYANISVLRFARIFSIEINNLPLLYKTQSPLCTQTS